MKKNLITRFLAIVLIGVFSQAVLADHHMSAAKVAEVLSNFNHFPSDENKAELMAIAENDANSEEIRTIARAVANIQHSATDEDKAALQEIVDSDSASEEAKTLAEVVLDVNHSTSEEAKEQLASIQ